MTSSLDELLIGIFLSISLAFIILWGIAILKWRKKFVYRLMPCFVSAKHRRRRQTSTSTASISHQNTSKKEQSITVTVADQQQQQVPQVSIISNDLKQINSSSNEFNEISLNEPTVAAAGAKQFDNPGYDSSSTLFLNKLSHHNVNNNSNNNKNRIRNDNNKTGSIRNIDMRSNIDENDEEDEIVYDINNNNYQETTMRDDVKKNKPSINHDFDNLDTKQHQQHQQIQLQSLKNKSNYIQDTTTVVMNEVRL